MKRVAYQEMANEFARVLTARGFSAEDAQAAAEIFAQNSLAGVYSHGLNRFPRLVSASCVLSFGNMERWDGHRGFGPLNAKRAMSRVCLSLQACSTRNHKLHKKACYFNTFLTNIRRRK